ncbi:MAG: hypothetical protein GY679_04110, partial [Mycoplasma sp.]|nr:hypothetical protein [Mycoplasma sp.]
GGNNNKVTWKSIQAVIDFAENAGLLIEFARSKDGKYSSDLPEQLDPDTSKRQLWVRINPKPGFALSSNKTQNNKTDITKTSDLFRIKQEVDVVGLKLLSYIKIKGNTRDIKFDGYPTPKGAHYEFQLGATDNVWKTWKDLVKAAKAKELFWAPGTGNSGPTWIAKVLKVKMVADPGYELKTATGISNETAVVTRNISEFKDLKRVISKKMIDELIDIFDKELHVTGDTHAMSWSTGNILNFMKNHGLKKEAMYIHINYNGKSQSVQTNEHIDKILKWKKMPDKYFLIETGNERKLSLKFLDRGAADGFIIESSAKNSAPLNHTGFNAIPMYIDTSPIDMHPELSGTTIKLDNLTHKSSSVKGYTPDFLYSIDNGQHWITKDELIKLYDGSDANKNLWIPGTKTEKGKWIASTNGNILVKLKPAKYTVLSTDKQASFPLSSLTKLLKFIPDGTADSMLEEIKKDVKTSGGNNNKVTWKSIQAVIDFAENAGLLIEFARSKDGKYSSDLPEQLDP